jgi:LysW-gamma-L-lysine carboxypeptidase
LLTMSKVGLSVRSLKEQAVGFLEDILRIYSPSGREAALAGFLKDRMKRDFGFINIHLDSVNNVIGEIGSGRPVILLCGHMDTVPGQQPIKVEDGLIYGRGASDAKSALAAMIISASAYAQSEDAGRIIVALVCDEEGKGMGMRELLRHSLEADFAIFGEPSGLDNITIGYKGRLALDISCETPSVHASAPWMSQNAIEKMFEVWAAIQAYALNSKKEEDRYKSLTASLTRIQGGSAQNVAPGKCKVTADIRIPPQLTCTQVLDDIGCIVNRFQQDVSFPKIHVDVVDFTEPFETRLDSPLVRSMVRAILQIRRKRPTLLRKTGTGDMNILGHALKIPAVSYGPGNAHLSHTSRECVALDEYLLSVEVFQQTIANLCSIWTTTNRT